MSMRKLRVITYIAFSCIGLILIGHAVWFFWRAEQNTNLPQTSEKCDCCGPLRWNVEGEEVIMNGALLSTRFSTLDELKQVVDIAYHQATMGKESVKISHCSNGIRITSLLETGVSEEDMRVASRRGYWAQYKLILVDPYLFWNSRDLIRVFLLSRRKHDLLGPGDVAFYDFAEMMVDHILPEDKENIRQKDLTEKGYLNTFNHVAAQAFVTTLFSEELAEFVADIHERHNMPELITGRFRQEQMNNPDQNPMDNYVDMMNNEWGQELGKKLKGKHRIDENTRWSPELIAAYMNDVQDYHSWAFQIGFEPFQATDERVIRFSKKLNDVLSGVKASDVQE